MGSVFSVVGNYVKTNPDARFISIGFSIAGDINRYKREYLDSRTARHLIIAGYRYDAHRIISGSDALIATARDEPLGRTIIEAAILRTMILAADSGGHRELLAPEASMCLVGDQTTRGFMDALDEFDARKARYDAIAPALATAFTARFSPVRHTDAVIDTYRSLT